MRRRHYDDSYLDRPTYERSVLRPDWGRPHPDDPNWRDGHYHGMRSAAGPWQAPYGRHRLDHYADLHGSGGFEGRYGQPMGGFRQDGLLGYQDRRARPRHEVRPWRYDAALHDQGEGWQGGGVRADIGYLRQYNSASPALRYGGDYARSAAWAERTRHRNPYPVEEPTHEREYGGYNRAGWAPGTWPGPGSRSWNPGR